MGLSELEKKNGEFGVPEQKKTKRRGEEHHFCMVTVEGLSFCVCMGGD